MARITTRPDEDITPDNPALRDLEPNTEWRSRIRDYSSIGDDANARIEAFRDKVYALVLATGAKNAQVAKYFALPEALVKSQLGPVIEMATAELQLAIQAKQIHTALTSKQPISHIWAGKQFAGQTDAPAAATTGDDGSVEVRINVVRKGDDVVSAEDAPSAGEGVDL